MLAMQCLYPVPHQQMTTKSNPARGKSTGIMLAGRQVFFNYSTVVDWDVELTVEICQVILLILPRLYL